MQMVTLPHATSRQRIAQAFDRGASEYLTLARAQHVMASRLFETLPTTLPDAAVVLDLGCGPGQWTRELACRYPTARCLGLDLSMAMLREASRSPTRRLGT
ncbi:methyltransferase domain-containing protein [Cobetia marina]